MKLREPDCRLDMLGKMTSQKKTRYGGAVSDPDTTGVYHRREGRYTSALSRYVLNSSVR